MSKYSLVKLTLLIITLLSLITLSACYSTSDSQGSTDIDNENEGEIQMINIQVGDETLTATLVNNSSVDALVELLQEGPLTIDMVDYGNMEKVGPIGTTLPSNNSSITAQPGDLILYQGSALVIYYKPNSWNFTRLGSINDKTSEELLEILGSGDVQVTLSLT